MRKIADCRAFPSESGCSLTISGAEEEVVRAAAEHAVSVHGHEDTAGLREQVRAGLADEGPAGRYGTVMIGTLTGDAGALHRAAAEWAQERPAPGFLSEDLLVGDDGRTVVVPAFFESREAYARLSDDPEQARWWEQVMAPPLTDVRWVDGTWQQTLTRAAPPAVPAPR